MTHPALMFVLIAVGLAAVLLIAFGFVGLRSGAAGTRGAPIERYDRPGWAVIVVDVQEDFTRRSEGRLGFAPDVLEGFFAVVNDVQAAAREAGIPVVHVRQVFEELPARVFARLFVEGRGIVGRPGTRLDPRLEVAASDVELTKKRGDSFSNPDLDAFLRSRKVDHVSILGLDGVACVTATARGALARGYHVRLVRDGILTSKPRRWRALVSELERRGARAAPGADLARAMRYPPPSELGGTPA